MKSTARRAGASIGFAALFVAVFVATSPVFRIPPDRSTAAVARLQPAVPEILPSSKANSSGPPPGIGVPVTSVETYLWPIGVGSGGVSAVDEHAAVAAARPRMSSSVRIRPA